ncbi:MAG TPA: transcription elongation factor GreA [Candidatus Paceibacterota bacterium]|nr:transcription elongation factor GreA [Candidatus Paceibacterota bacterium]
MNSSDDYITKEKRLELQAELEDLKGPKRKEILAALEYAKSLGDLSENAEYHQTREDQGKLEERIVKIENILKSSQTFSRHGGDVIEVGSKVVAQKDGVKKDIIYRIVGSEEANMADGKISNKSPMGVAFLGKKKGDNVSFMTPGGEVTYKILSVS